MESRTDEFFKAVKDGQLSQTDIYSEIESLTGGMRPERLLLLQEEIRQHLGYDVFDAVSSYLDSMDSGEASSNEAGVAYIQNAAIAYVLDIVTSRLKGKHIGRMDAEIVCFEENPPNKPKVNSEDVEDVCGILTSYFDDESFTDLTSLLSGKVEPSRPLLFKGNWKQLGNAFGQLHKYRLLDNISNQDALVEWLWRNFVTDNRDFKKSVLKTYVSRDLTAYGNAILRIDQNTKKVTKA